MFSLEVVRGDESVAPHSGDNSKFEMSLTTCWVRLFVNVAYRVLWIIIFQSV